MYKTIKHKIYNIICDDNQHNTVGKIFNTVIVLLILLNVVTIVADTFDLPSTAKTVINYIDTISVIIFTIEYLLRIFTADLLFPNISPIRARLKYIFSFMAIVDLLAILPFYIPFVIKIDLRSLRLLRLLRLVRLFKLNRYTSALRTVGAVLAKKKNQLLSSVFVVFILMLISSILMYNIENEAQPDVFSNAFSALWWSVATFTTVGYGDIYPITPLGKILSSVIALLGIGHVAVPTGIISAGFIEISDDEQKNTADEPTEEMSYCPYCGKKIK